MMTPRGRSAACLRRFARAAAFALAAPGVAAVAPVRAAAQAAAPVPGEAAGLSLSEVLRAATAHHPGVRSARLRVDAARGEVAVASAPFDAQLRSSIGSGRQSQPAFVDAASADVSSTLSRSLDYQASLEKQLRWGVIVAPQLELSRLGFAGAAALPVTRATAGLSIVLPLARDRLGHAVAATERAAGLELDATDLDLRQAVAQAQYDAGTAYWNYAAALQRLDAYRDSERRAALLVEETRALVRADERPAADLKQLLGNLATKRAQRIIAEQGVVEARQQLGIAMGMSAAETAALPGVSTAYPSPRDTSPTVDPTLVTTALTRRPDLLAAAARSRHAREQLTAAANGLRPRLDLVVGTSYSGVDRGFGVERFVAPLYRNIGGMNTTVQLQYDLPVRNAAARGWTAQLEAAHEQRRIAEADLANRIAGAVHVAVAGLESGRLALIETREAVGLSRETVDNEKQKFTLGVSTQIDVILAEDALTNALLTEITARRGYAAALATLRFSVGDLSADASGAAVATERLLTEPSRPAPPATAPRPDRRLP